MTTGNNQLDQTPETEKANTDRSFWSELLAFILLAILTSFEVVSLTIVLFVPITGVLATGTALYGLLFIALLAPTVAVSIWLLNDCKESCKLAYYNLPRSSVWNTLALFLLAILVGLALYFVALVIISMHAMLWPAAALFALNFILTIPAIIIVYRWRFDDWSKRMDTMEKEILVAMLSCFLNKELKIDVTQDNAKDLENIKSFISNFDTGKSANSFGKPICPANDKDKKALFQKITGEGAFSQRTFYFISNFCAIEKRMKMLTGEISNFSLESRSIIHKMKRDNEGMDTGYTENSWRKKLVKDKKRIEKEKSDQLAAKKGFLEFINFAFERYAARNELSNIYVKQVKLKDIDIFQLEKNFETWFSDERNEKYKKSIARFINGDNYDSLLSIRYYALIIVLLLRKNQDTLKSANNNNVGVTGAHLSAPTNNNNVVENVTSIQHIENQEEGGSSPSTFTYGTVAHHE